MSEQQSQGHEAEGREPDGEYTDTENGAGQREEPPAEPAGSYVDVDETHVATGVEGQYTDLDGENVPGSEEPGRFTDTDR